MNITPNITPKLTLRRPTQHTVSHKQQNTHTQFGSVHPVVFQNIPPERQQLALKQASIKIEEKTGRPTEPLYLYQPIADCFEHALAATRNLMEALEAAAQFALANKYPTMKPKKSIQIPIKAYLFHDDQNYADATQLLACSEQGYSPLQLYVSAREWSRPYSTLYLQEAVIEGKPTLIISEQANKA